MWLLPLIFTGASYAENIWLTVWSEVNMQQNINEYIRGQKKIITMHKAWHLWNDVDCISQEKKEEEKSPE